MNDQIVYVKNLIENMTPENTIIFSHADHDGFTASVLLNSYFHVFHNATAPILYPNAEHSYLENFTKVLNIRPKNFVILDSLISRYRWMLEKIGKYSLIINLDHHDNVELTSPNYVNVNPHNWGIEYLNSSGLVWLVLRELDRGFFNERGWVAAVGALQDYCIEGSELLFKTVMRAGLVNNIGFGPLLSSELMKVAKIIVVNCKYGNPEYVYDRLMEATLTNDIDSLLDDNKLLLEYNKYRSTFQSVYQDYLICRKVFPAVNLVAYDLRGVDILFFSEIGEKERSKNIYVGYSNGLLTFRSLFYDYDVRLLAKLFNGGGPHPRAAGARTTTDYNQAIEKIFQYLKFQKEQVSITNFF